MYIYLNSIELLVSINEIKNEHGAMIEHDYDDRETVQSQQSCDISMLGTLLFKTIQEALRKPCLDIQKEESLVILQMEEMNNEMRHLERIQIICIDKRRYFNISFYLFCIYQYIRYLFSIYTQQFLSVQIISGIDRIDIYSFFVPYSIKFQIVNIIYKLSLQST